MPPTLKIVRCPKCGDPSPWHRGMCELKWSVGEREAMAHFNSHEKAEAAAHRVMAQPDVHDIVLYDLEGRAVRRLDGGSVSREASQDHGGPLV